MKISRLSSVGYSSYPDEAEDEYNEEAAEAREEGKRLNWEEEHLTDETCPTCGQPLERGYERYGDDADGNRGINREVLFCRNCD